jgi:Zn finger protein HypA/HybF involved in hydrogenase expression
MKFFFSFENMPSYEEDYEEEFDNDEENLLEEEEQGVMLACEDCDYRWKVEFDDEFYDYSDSAICPMCGSANVVEI